MGIKYCPDCTREWGVLDERTNRFESRAARYCGTCGRPVQGYHPPNPPLTLDELRGMDGEPVWCDDMNSWGIVDSTYNKFREPALIGIKNYPMDRIIACGLKIYRRRPEEELK